MKGSDSVVAVDRCFDILEYISNATAPVGVKELSIKLDIPNASCFRIVKNMIRRGYLEESISAPGQYVLGIEIMKLAEKKKRGLDVRTIAVPVMSELAEKLCQTVQLGRLEESGVIYIEQALSRSPISVIGALFKPMSVNVSASGKVLCAYLPMYEQNSYIEDSIFAKQTDNSILDKVEFKKILQSVKKKGYATDIEEFGIGIGCLAVPIFDYRGKCVASIGLTGNVEDYIDENKLNCMLKNLKEAADLISYRLGAKLNAS